MPKITEEDIETLKKAGWVVYDSGFPPDLFFSVKGAGTPWADKPHLHLNYAIGGELQSLTWKNDQGGNAYLFQREEWFAFDKVPEGLKAQAEWLQTNLK